MSVRGKKSFMPPKRPSAGKMFTGADRSGPHLDLLAKAVKCASNVGPKKNTVKAPDQPKLRHQPPN